MSKDNHVPDINFDEVSQSLRVNFTTGQSDPTSYMRMEIPKNLLENIIQIQVGYKNGSLSTIPLDGNTSSIVQYTQTPDLNIFTVTILPKIAMVLLKG